MNAQELNSIIEKWRIPIYEFVSNQFDVRPSEPTLYLGHATAMGTLSGQLSKQGRRVVGPAFYRESEQKIVIDPNAVEEVTHRARSVAGIRINPRYHGPRMLAKEYGQHCLAFLDGFQSLDHIDNYLQQLATQQPSQDAGNEVLRFNVMSSIPVAKMEAAGFAAYLKSARQFQHRDDYYAHYQRQCSKARDISKNILLGRQVEIPDNMLSFRVSIALAQMLGERWAELGKEEFRQTVREPVTGVSEKEVEEFTKYLLA